MTTDDQGASVREWTDVVRRARLGRAVKLVALTVATYADSDGTRIFPGTARLAVDAEMSHTTVKKAMATLRDLGLLERVAYGARRNAKCDEYRLILGPDVLERVEVLTPAQVSLDAHRVNGHRPATDLGTVRVTAKADVLGTPRATANGRRAADLGTPTVTAKPAGTETFGDTTATPNPDLGTVSELFAVTLTDRHHSYRPRHVTTTDHPTAEVLTEPHGVARASPDDEPTDRLPEKCAHGLRARRRDDGTSSCALCRITARINTPRPTPQGATP